MQPRSLRRRAAAVIAALTACAALTTTQAQATPTQDVITPATKFYVDPHSNAANQALVDFRNSDFQNATNMAGLASWPQAEWFTKGTPGEVRTTVKKLVHRARTVHRTPVLVAYDIPGRDCSQYSSGGAASSAYRQWIDALAAGIGVPLVDALPAGPLGRGCRPGSRAGAFLQLLEEELVLEKGDVVLVAGLRRQQLGGLEQAPPVVQRGKPGGVGRLVAVTGCRTGSAGPVVSGPAHDVGVERRRREVEDQNVLSHEWPPRVGRLLTRVTQ
jgi:hypothetical protein